MTMSFKTMLLALTCGNALAISSVAHAQGSSPTEGASSADQSGIADIVVSARRRDESIQKTPIGHIPCRYVCLICNR